MNDAPALKAADIGVAMGGRGTDAARQAADLVLTDDNSPRRRRGTRGRVVFDNIKKALVFILPTNGAEAGVILLAVFAGLSLPVTASQIPVGQHGHRRHAGPGLRLRAGGGRRHAPPAAPAGRGAGHAAAVVAHRLCQPVDVRGHVYGFEWQLGQGSSIETARTAAVNMLVVGELIYLFNVRHFHRPLLQARHFSRNWVAFWASLILIGLQLAFIYAPPMQRLFKTTPLDGDSHLLILALGALLFVAVEAEKWLLRRRGVQHM